MKNGVRDLKDDEIIRFQRFGITESAAATFTQQSYDTQLSIDRGLIWMIHWVEWDINISHIDDPATATFETLAGQVTRESKSSILVMSDPDLVAVTVRIWKRSAAIGTDAGPLAVFDSYPDMQVFSPALPYAASQIFVGIIGSATTAKTITGRIAYTLRRVSDKFFYRVAHALIS